MVTEDGNGESQTIQEKLASLADEVDAAATDREEVTELESQIDDLRDRLAAARGDRTRRENVAYSAGKAVGIKQSSELPPGVPVLSPAQAEAAIDRVSRGVGSKADNAWFTARYGRRRR